MPKHTRPQNVHGGPNDGGFFAAPKMKHASQFTPCTWIPSHRDDLFHLYVWSIDLDVWQYQGLCTMTEVRS